MQLYEYLFIRQAVPPPHNLKEHLGLFRIYKNTNSYSITFTNDCMSLLSVASGALFCVEKNDFAFIESYGAFLESPFLLVKEFRLKKEDIYADN